MTSVTYLTAFNNLILKFNNDLIETFPEENDFKVYKRGFELLFKANAKKTCIFFKNYVINYRDKILNKDESFFLANDYSDIVDTSQDGMVDIVNKLKKYWGQLTTSNKDKIWDYLITLIKLSDLVS